MDLVGPLLTSPEGFKYLFTMVDRSSRWLEAAPLKSMAAEDCVDALISSWVARFGGANHHHFRPRPLVHLLPVGRPHQAAGDQAGGHFFSGHGRLPVERCFHGQTHFGWQASPVFPAPSPAFRGCGEPFYKVLPQTSHGVEHHLETRGPPIASPFRRLFYSLYKSSV
jgi:hypothetical protein